MPYPDDDARYLADGYLAAARAPRPAQAPEVTYGPMGDRYEIERYEPPTVLGMDPLGVLGQFMFRRGPAGALPRGPWNPAPRPQAPRREAKLDGDDSVAQHVYEAMLGRTRAPGEAVGRPGSGWHMVGNQPIPKITNPIGWLIGALGGYAGYKVGTSIFGDPLPDIRYRWEHGVFPEDDPKNPRYDKQRHEHIAKYAGEAAAREARSADAEIERRLGLTTNWSGPVSIFGPHPEPDDTKRATAVVNYRTRGGIGNAPY